MLKAIYLFFDKLEDRIRGKLSRWPIVYAFLGGVGIVLFWRGVWHLTDTFMFHYFRYPVLDAMDGVYELPWWDGLLSLSMGTILLLLSGLFVSNFIGNEIVISGLRGEKKTVDKTTKEIILEKDKLVQIQRQLNTISEQISHVHKKRGK